MELQGDACADYRTRSELKGMRSWRLDGSREYVKVLGGALRQKASGSAVAGAVQSSVNRAAIKQGAASGTEGAAAAAGGGTRRTEQGR